MGLGAAGGLLDEKGRFPGIEKPMTVDALSCVFAGLVGTTTSGAYIESATGIGNGLTAGLVLYPIVKVAAARGRDVRGGAWALAAIGGVYFVFGLPH